MKILSANDTFITAGISGGLPGLFEVNVIKTGFGNAIANPTSANNFAYEVLVTGVSPSSGSIGGGTLITITGKNFVPDALDTMVTIGNELNQLCTIESISETEIKCRTPLKNFYYDIGVPQVVIVNSKLIIDTNCSNSDNCWFTFISQENSPLLQNISSTAMTTGSLTLTGQGFTLGDITTVSLTNKISGVITEVTPTAFNDSSITITLPAI